MRRRVVPVPVGQGSWLRLECGHRLDATAVLDDMVDCASCDRRRLPQGLRLARRTPTFTSRTTPAALRQAHRTTVWAELVVTAGSVQFRDEDPSQPWATTAGAGQRVTIVPGRPHAVTPSTDARFHVRFYSPVLVPVAATT